VEARRDQVCRPRRAARPIDAYADIVDDIILDDGFGRALRIRPRAEPARERYYGQMPRSL
jgi:hypothetical protein